MSNSKKQLRGFANLDQRKNINKKGRPKSGQALTDMTRKFLSEIDAKTGRPRLESLVQKVLSMAESGNERLLIFLWEQLDGKAIQTVTANLSRGLEDVSDEELNLALHDVGV